MKIITFCFIFCLFAMSENREFFNQYNHIINSNSQRTGITSNLIKSIIYCESYMISNAKRYESHLTNAGWYTNTIPIKYRYLKLSYTSLGLMQILPGIAYILGYEGHPRGLYRPDVNIYYGTRHLLNLIRAYRYQKPSVSAYNCGYSKIKKDGTYKNQNYVNNVVRMYKKYKKDYQNDK